MATQAKTRRIAAARTRGVEARDLWLAGLGAVSLTRKQGLRLYGTLLEEGRQLQGRVEETFEGLQDQARVGVEVARDRVDALVTPLRGRMQEIVAQARGEIAARIGPVLEKLGVKRGVPPQVRVKARRTAGKGRRVTSKRTRRTRSA